jgi:hypothetical protein
VEMRETELQSFAQREKPATQILGSVKTDCARVTQAVLLF